MNSVGGFTSCKKPFGMDLERQKEFLEEFNDFIRSAETFHKPRKDGLQHFQHGMLVNNASLPELLKYLQQEDDSIKYILTRRINQDDVERLFGVIRMRGCGGYVNPTKTDVMNRLKGMMLARTDELQRIPMSSNVEEGAPGWIKVPLLKRKLDAMRLQETDLEIEINDEIENMPFKMNKHVNSYIAGYLVYRLKRDIGSGEGECEWIDLLSEGRLKKPSQLFIDYLMLHFDIFNMYFKSKVPNILNILKTKSNCCDKILEFEGTVQSLSDKKFCQRIKDIYFKCLIRSKVRAVNEETAQKKADNYAAKKIKEHIK